MNSLQTVTWILVGLALVPPASAQRIAQAPVDVLQQQDRDVPRMEDAEAQLRHASVLRTRMRRKRDGELERARQRAIQAYLAVSRFHSDDAARCAEAFFRAGELERAAGATGEALQHFSEARRRGKKTAFRARAGLEIGNIHRRRASHQAALAAYEEVITDDRAAIKVRDVASYWSGRVLIDMGRPRDARRVLRRVATSSRDTFQKIRAFDELVLLTISEGDLEWAAGILEQCRKAVGTRAVEQTKRGERVRSALENMRCVPVLKRAIRERRDSKKPVVTDKIGSGDVVSRVVRAGSEPLPNRSRRLVADATQSSSSMFQDDVRCVIRGDAACARIVFCLSDALARPKKYSLIGNLLVPFERRFPV